MDETHKKMLQIHTLCNEMDIDVPDDVDEFFKYQDDLTDLIEEKVNVVESDKELLVEINPNQIPKNCAIIRVLIPKNKGDKICQITK